MTGKEENVKSREASCPYCDKEITKELYPFCSACQVTIAYCSSCGKPLPKGKNVCPTCGAKAKR